jgi:hypothetical protein
MKTTAASRTRLLISSRVEPTPPSPEKKIESRITAPKSAIVPAATISCPKVEEISPASFSTGMRTPSEVAQRMIATKSGVSMSPLAFSAMATTIAIRNESTKPSRVRRRTRPRNRSKSISRPARKSRKARPITEITEIVRSTWTIASTDGPMRMPARISNTTDGRRTRGNRPSTSGTAKATATTMSRPLNGGMTASPLSIGGRYAHVGRGGSVTLLASA